MHARPASDAGPTRVRRKRRTVGALAAAAGLIALAAGCETPHDLGTFGGMQSAAADVNAAGIAVGWADTIAGGARAFASAPGQPLRPLGSLEPTGDGGRSVAAAINGHGDIAGTRGGLGVVWRHDGTVVELPAYPPPDSWTPVSVEPEGINDAGVVVGSISLLYGEARLAFVWRPGDAALTRIDPAGGLPQGRASDINAAGQIVGQGAHSGGVKALLWEPDGSGGWRPPVPLPLLAGSTYGAATAISDGGTIVGSSLAPDFTSRAVVWRGPDHAVTEVPTPVGSAYANDVNEAGVVVGSMSSTGNIWDPKPAAFKWVPGDPKATELLGLGGRASSATAINDAGVIVGQAANKDQNFLRAVRWVDEEPPALY